MSTTDVDALAVRDRWLWFVNPVGCWLLEFLIYTGYGVVAGIDRD